VIAEDTTKGMGFLTVFYHLGARRRRGKKEEEEEGGGIRG